MISFFCDLLVCLLGACVCEPICVFEFLCVCACTAVPVCSLAGGLKKIQNKSREPCICSYITPQTTG